MKKVTSKDGTVISYDQFGSGLPVILVDGALCSRDFGPMPKLAGLLADFFTVINYDRRGRMKAAILSLTQLSVKLKISQLLSIVPEDRHL